MKLLDYTIESGFLPHLKCANLTEVVVDLVRGLAACDEGVECDGLVDDILDREAEGSTAIGGGVVIPHARSSRARTLRIAVATLDVPLDIPAEDDRPVDVVILLVGPIGDPRQMLRLLARLARLVKQDAFLDTLRSAPDAAALMRAFAAAAEAAS